MALRAEMDLMKEKFAKLLLGEDMSGSGKGVPSALALSNAVTNLAGDDLLEYVVLVSCCRDRETCSLQRPRTVFLPCTRSLCVRRAEEAGAHGSGQEGEVEEGGRLAPLRRRPHRRVRRQETSPGQRHRNGGPAGDHICICHCHSQIDPN